MANIYKVGFGNSFSWSTDGDLYVVAETYDDAASKALNHKVSKAEGDEKMKTVLDSDGSLKAEYNGSPITVKNVTLLQEGLIK